MIIWAIKYIYEGGYSAGIGNYIYVLCEMFINFTQYAPLVCFILGGGVIYTSCTGVILPLNLHYICFCVDIFVNNITLSSLTCVFMLYSIIISYTPYWEFGYLFLLCMGYSTNASLLHLRLYY